MRRGPFLKKAPPDPHPKDFYIGFVEVHRP